MPIAVFYVSGHGFGHAVRMAEVIRALGDSDADWSVVVRTTAPPVLFEGLARVSIQVQPVSIDAGVIEGNGTLAINVDATLERLKPFLDRHDEIVSTEAAFVRAAKADVIVADIPYLAGAIGHAAKVPVLGISNFTWDFIYEPFVADKPWGSAALQAMKDGYDKMQALLRLPFHHEMHYAAEVLDVGIVAPRSNRPREEILGQIGVDKSDKRTRVYVGMRGTVPPETLRRAAEESVDCLFLHTSDVTCVFPENARRVTICPELSFPDLLVASNIVISKLGYGMVAACVANGASLLFPTRSGFREDIALRQGSQRYLRAHEFSAADFHAGNWRAPIQILRERPLPSATLPLDGADQCARMIASLANGK
ncbi:MAG TPA: hypothetical protein VHR66_16680 [Gemmataceae bacterium]|jgi:L-arabinokinase|nr:hypothetical protein [Gemmataceae bacterium]